jgi:hypothetical protein
MREELCPFMVSLGFDVHRVYTKNIKDPKALPEWSDNSR